MNKPENSDLTFTRKNKNDIRFQRTEQAIRSAFAELTTQKPVNEITIIELCTLAGINKSTFYLHYQDIFELESRFVGLIIEHILSIFMDYEYNNLLSHTTEIWSRIIHLFDGEPPLCISFRRSPNLANLLSRIDTTIISLLMDSLKEKQPELRKEELTVHRLTLTFIVNGYIGLIRNYPPEELTPGTMQMLSDCLQRGFSKAGLPAFTI